MKYLELLKESQAEMIKSLGELVSKESVRTSPVRGKNGSIYPFGVGVQESYEYIMNLGKKLGFDIYDADNYGGHIEYRDADSEGTFGISGHIDVMPEGTGWKTPAFDLIQKDGWLFGRGVLDDKGPVVACLYAMKAIRDASLKPKMGIRLIIGLDEETGMEGMKYYLDKVGHPDMGFTPDGDFPLVNGEMGIAIFDLCKKLTNASKDGLRLTKLTGGTAPNVVPGECKATLVSSDKAEYDRIKELVALYREESGYKISCKKQGPSMQIIAQGRSVHGAYPETGLNAISIMMEFLEKLSFNCEELNEYIDFYNKYIGFDVFGERIAGGVKDEESGNLKFNVGQIAINEEMASITVNIRVPVSHKVDEVFGYIREIINPLEIGMVRGIEEDGVYLDTTHPMVGNLMEAYKEVTGEEESEPSVSPGGTYAKEVNNTLAFGPLFPGEEDTIHQPNERMSVESFEKMAEIYARAIVKICC